MNDLNFYGCYQVVLCDVYPVSVVYYGMNYKRAYRLFEKYSRKRSVELWINGTLVESRS